MVNKTKIPIKHKKMFLACIHYYYNKLFLFYQIPSAAGDRQHASTEIG